MSLTAVTKTFIKSQMWMTEAGLFFPNKKPGRGYQGTEVEGSGRQGRWQSSWRPRPPAPPSRSFPSLAAKVVAWGEVRSVLVPRPQIYSAFPAPTCGCLTSPPEGPGTQGTLSQHNRGRKRNKAHWPESPLEEPHVHFLGHDVRTTPPTPPSLTAWTWGLGDTSEVSVGLPPRLSPGRGDCVCPGVPMWPSLWVPWSPLLMRTVVT